jgi:hypothetical protein
VMPSFKRAELTEYSTTLRELQLMGYAVPQRHFRPPIALAFL